MPADLGDSIRFLRVCPTAFAIRHALLSNFPAFSLSFSVPLFRIPVQGPRVSQDKLQNVTVSR